MSVSFRKWIKIFGAAYSSWAAWIGTILATVALCNLAFRFLNVSVFEALAWILTAYRKTFHPPIDYLLSFISLPLPSIAKDFLVIYLAMGGILYRTLSYKEPSPLLAQFRARQGGYRLMDLRMWMGQVRAAVLWPRCLKTILWHPGFLIRSSLGYHGRMPPPRQDLPPDDVQTGVMKEMLAYSGKDAVVICNERQLLLVYAVTLLAAVLGLVILNAAVDGLTDAFAKVSIVNAPPPVFFIGPG